MLKAGEGVAGGLFRGLAGVISKPIEGAQRGGVLGFATGVAQGAVGLVVKPVVGVADGITSASEGIRNTSASASSQGIFAQRQVRPFAPVARHCHAPPKLSARGGLRGAAAASRDRPVRRAAAVRPRSRRGAATTRRGDRRCRFSRTAARRRPVLLSLCMHRWPRERAGRLPASCADHNARGLPLALGWELGRARVGRAAVGDRHSRGGRRGAAHGRALGRAPA